MELKEYLKFKRLAVGLKESFESLSILGVFEDKKNELLNEIEFQLSELDKTWNALLDEIDAFHSQTGKECFDKHLKKVLHYSSLMVENATPLYQNKGKKLSRKHDDCITTYYLISVGLASMLQYEVENINYVIDSKEKPSTRQLLTTAHKENGGRLTSEQLKELAEKYNLKSLKYVQNLYSEILPDLK